MLMQHGSSLRKGRVSETNRIYLITTVTQNRIRVFDDFRVGRVVVQSMREMDAEKFCSTLAFTVMPDHLHWLLSLSEQVSLSDLVRLMKGRSSKRISESFGIKGIWQKGFHDHALRKEEDVEATARYVIANPLRAGLVERLGDYSLWDAVYF
jgi:putative transposase